MNSKKDKGHIPESYASKTDVGNVREHNEDSLIASSPLFAVADGMGGHEAGEVASEIAVTTMAGLVPEGPDAQALAAAVKEANAAVLRGAADGTGRPGMGTTMTTALVYDDQVIIAQVGDSRAYLVHNGSLQRITRDHSLVADLVEQGRITEEEARVHPQRSVITRALGSDPRMEPDTYRLQVEEGDRLMLCSDGLSSMVEDDVIEQALISNPDPQAACDVLVAEALAAGGMDNVTVIVVDPLAVVEADGSTSPSAANSGSKKRNGKRKAKRSKAPIIWLIAFVLVIAGACAGFYAYTQNSYYLMTQNGHVTLFKGLPGQFAGISFSWVEEETDIDASKLVPSTAGRLEGGISVDSKQAAEELLQTYRQMIDGTAADNTGADAAGDAGTDANAARSN